MAGRYGTRQRTSNSAIQADTRVPNGDLSADVGISKRFFGTVTFHSTGNSLTAANGAFAGFIAGDPLIVHGTNLNDGERQITAIDSTNHAYLVVAGPTKDEGPVANVEVRTP